MKALLALLIICMTGCTQPAPGVTVLTYASPFSPSHPFSRADIVWMKWVEQQARRQHRDSAVLVGIVALIRTLDA